MPSGQPAAKRTRDKPVSVDEIAQAALALLDEVGLEALTMRRLAGAIGVEPMTLYRYLPNKEAILAVVADLLWQELRPFVPEVEDWQARVRIMWLEMFDLMMRHPHAVPLIARTGSYSRTAAEGTARMLGVLQEAGFPPDLATDFLHTVSALVVGFAFAHLWQRLEKQGQRPATPAGRIGPVLTEIHDYARSIGPWTPGQFTSALDMTISAFATRLHRRQDIHSARSPA
jgi:AcrR family transcriptional regulator